jgi:hypothetical protein
MAPNTPVTQNDTRKRKASYKITDENFVGAESNAVTKRLKLSDKAAQATTVNPLQQQSQVSTDIEDEDRASVYSSPKSSNATLEATDELDTAAESGDDDDILMLDSNPNSDSEEHGEDKEEEIEPNETAEQQRSESTETQ